MISQFCHAYLSAAGEIVAVYELDKPLADRDYISAERAGAPVALTRVAFALDRPRGAAKPDAATLRRHLERAPGPAAAVRWRADAPAELRGRELRPFAPRPLNPAATAPGGDSRP